MEEYICEKKSLSEIMKKEKGEELIFSAAGPHTDNKLSETMDKKIKDMGKYRFCLWAIKSDKADEIKKLCKDKEEIYVVLVENNKGENQNTVSGYHAVSTDDPQIKIPSDMWVTGAKSSQTYAYVVKEIIEIVDGKRGNFSRSRYDEIVHDFNRHNQFKRFNPDRKERRDYEHEVNYVLVLKSPFIVKLNMEKY